MVELAIAGVQDLCAVEMRTYLESVDVRYPTAAIIIEAVTLLVDAVASTGSSMLQTIDVADLWVFILHCLSPAIS